MILNLRQYMSQPVGSDSYSLNTFHARSRHTYPESEYAQNAFLGNLGAPLRTFDEDEDIYDDGDVEGVDHVVDDVSCETGDRVLWHG